jgi:hypothetical protein
LVLHIRPIPQGKHKQCPNCEMYWVEGNYWGKGLVWWNDKESKWVYAPEGTLPVFNWEIK